ncbi:hypothetical protein Rsub_01803 [Raphidocelis subcapitata]|uniref:CHCH domain-containing protein n=1 Tax=Raphidocelis subcapitata TaxID=307507 RepID=A0A2V0NNF7_9CHLO|nr:hypothetical protein Rsub_01803 [Raphidocelis subcapitata]|eukprot:GBF89086.1 hypothetical protein Rsub_01803 [Raphidocelis subcapitata]
MASCRAGTAEGAEDEAKAARVSEALGCPCVADLRRGPCGSSFVTAFSCFHLSAAEPRGCECLAVNLAFAACLRAHPDAAGGGGGGERPPAS